MGPEPEVVEPEVVEPVVEDAVENVTMSEPEVEMSEPDAEPEIEDEVEEILATMTPTEAVVPESTTVPEDVMDALPDAAGSELSGAFSPYGADPMSTMLL